MIDSQERSKENLSVLYLNNKKIQGAKNNQNAIQAFELLADFIDAFKLTNTKEIFNSEANYTENKQARNKLKEKYGDNGKCLALELLQGTKNAKTKPVVKIENKQEVKPTAQEKNIAAATTKNNEDYKANMNDLTSNFDKFDKLMAQRSKVEQNNVISDTKNTAEPKPFINSVLSKKEEPKQNVQEENPLFGNIQLKSKIGVKESQDGQLNSMSNLSSNKKSSKHNDTEDMLVSESMGYDISVQSDTLHEFDYMESIENDN